tara:strand:+ start:1579 stop:3765 length:2187 start_codon:yes stop_codon:yes gene_type:complete
MINTNKFIPKREEKVRLSTMTTIGLIKKDVVKIDNLLKEKLVISKVRYGILRQQNERERRSNRESVLESKKSRPQDYGVNLRSNKKGKGFGGFLGGIFKAILTSLGFSIFKSLPTLLKIGKLIKTIAVPFTIAATVAIATIRTITSVGSNIASRLGGKNLNPISQNNINSSIENFKNALFTTIGLFVGGAIAGQILRRAIGGQFFTREGALRTTLEDPKLAKSFGKKAIQKEFVNRKNINFKKTGLTKKEVNLLQKANPTRSERIQINKILDKNPAAGNIISSNIDQKFDAFYKGGGFKYNPSLSPSDNMAKFMYDIETQALKRGDDLFVESSRRVREKVERGQIKPSTPRTISKKLSNEKIFARAGEAEAERQLVNKLLNKESIKAQKQLVDTAKIRVDRSVSRRGVPIDFSGFEDVDIDEDELRRLDAEMRGEKPSKTRGKPFGRPTGIDPVTGRPTYKVNPRGRRINPEDGRFFAKRTSPKVIAKRALAKETAAKLATKKGLSRILFLAGGELFEQNVKQIIKQSVSGIPLIGDLIGLILDIALFGQSPRRAAFMALGSIIGGMIGGIVGLFGGPPGVLILSILGGIAGDVLGGAFHDLIFKTSTPPLIESTGKAAVKQGVKAGFMRGGYVPFGGIVHAGEFVIDADSTRAIERRSPGFLMALNKAKGSQVDEVLETYMSYGNDGEGTETLIPLPFEKIVTRTVVTNTGTKDDSSSPFMDLYRRG